MKRLGETLRFANPPYVIGWGSAVGPMEGQGPLGKTFDMVYPDLTMGEESFEKAERKLLEEACRRALQRAMLQEADIDLFLAGDLLNQITTSSFTALKVGAPFAGLYGACSTFALGIALGAALIDGGFCRRVLVGAASHNATAERQYRYPTEYGALRKPYSQWTVTGAGAVVLADEGSGPRVTLATLGKVADMGVKDPYNQGAAMAPAALQTIQTHLSDTNKAPEAYNMIATGDLAAFGRQMALDLARKQGMHLDAVLHDCGEMIFDREKQDVHSGGSGCGCSASVFCGHFMQQFGQNKLQHLLLVATGALLSTTTFQQGENIPSVAHAVAIEMI